MRFTVEFSPFELVQTAGALKTMAKPPEVVPARPDTVPPALHTVAFELCSGRLRRNMIDMIKRRRELTGNGLKESKDAIEAAFGAQRWITHEGTRDQ